jgi:2,4-dienoyl-CoA reductase-like NADH-dependent reductase (Old Yellow Enzyme family)
MPEIFESTIINGMKLNNRIVRSATWEGIAHPDGRPSEKLIDTYGLLARGGIGLIISGYAFVRPEGKQHFGQMGIYTDDFASEYRRIADAVHAENGKICMQIVHTGGQTVAANIGGRRPIGPSAVKVDQYDEIPLEMTIDDIRQVVSAFGDAAVRAKAYGFDAVQLHGAHGYLINQFLSPLTNRRTDAYGGSLENRSRFLMEIYRTIRERVGKDFPVMIKLSGSDFLEGGFTAEDAISVAKMLDKEGMDAIEVSGGTRSSGDQTPARAKIDSPDKEGYHLPLAKEMRKAVQCPLIVVGGFRSPAVIQKAIQEKAADYVALSRPFVREPDLASRWANGDQTPARCISCNMCFAPGFKGDGVYCVEERKAQRKAKSQK